MSHHSNSFITRKSFSLHVISTDLYEVPTYILTGLMCIPFLQLIEAFSILLLHVRDVCSRH